MVKMKIKLLGVMLWFLFCLPNMANATIPEACLKAEEIKDLPKTKVSTSDLVKYEMCLSFLKGWIAGVFERRLVFCPPEDTTLTDFTEVYAHFLNAYPKAYNEAMQAPGTALAIAVAEKWPCSQRDHAGMRIAMEMVMFPSLDAEDCKRLVSDGTKLDELLIEIVCRQFEE